MIPHKTSNSLNISYCSCLAPLDCAQVHGCERPPRPHLLNTYTDILNSEHCNVQKKRFPGTCLTTLWANWEKQRLRLSHAVWTLNTCNEIAGGA